MVSEPNLLRRIFFLFFPSPQWLLVHHSLPPTILSPSKSPKILNIPSLQSISPISPNCLFVFWANFRIVSYFCVLGFVYIYSFLINEKVKSLFLNNPLSTSTWYQNLIFLGVFSSFFFSFSSVASGASFSSTNDPITIQNSQDPQHPLLTINLGLFPIFVF